MQPFSCILWQNIMKIKSTKPILDGVDYKYFFVFLFIWNKEPDNFFDIFPQCKSDQTYALWHQIDLINMNKCKLFLDRTDIPSMFDVILLDGGEFTTYHEFQILKDKCKVLMLDDTECDKCKYIVQELLSDPSWKIVKQEKVRNGYVIAERQ